MKTLLVIPKAVCMVLITPIYWIGVVLQSVWRSAQEAAEAYDRLIIFLKRKYK